MKWPLAVRKFLAERWFLILLALILTAGFTAPERLAPWTRYLPEKTIVASVLFMMSVSLDSSSMFRAMRRPSAVIAAVFVNFVLVPLAAWPLSALLPGDLGAGLMIVAALPSTLASAAVWTRRAGGNDAIALLGTMVTNMASFVVTPLWLMLATGTEVKLKDPPLVMMGNLAVIVVLPMLAGQLVRLWKAAGAFATRHKLSLGVLAQFGIETIVLVGAVDAGSKISKGESEVLAAETAAMIAIVIALHLAMLAAGHLLGRGLGLPREDRIAVGFSGSQKTLMVGLHIARDYFSGLAMLPLIAYHVSQLFLDTLVADRLRKESPLPPAPPETPAERIVEADG